METFLNMAEAFLVSCGGQAVVGLEKKATDAVRCWLDWVDAQAAGRFQTAGPPDPGVSVKARSVLGECHYVLGPAQAGGSGQAALVTISPNVATLIRMFITIIQMWLANQSPATPAPPVEVTESRE